MSSTTSRNAQLTRLSNQGYLEEGEYPSENLPRAKRPRSGEQDELPKWLSRARTTSRFQESSRGPYVGDTATAQSSRIPKKGPNGSGATNWHSRIYVGNLPNQFGLASAAYKELFSALYVTAFGSLKPREAAPVQSFWLHSCGRYGFLLMRGNKEAVNVLIFNGLLFYGRAIRLNRPTGYRPEVKDLSAEEYVPDRVDGERVEALIKALCGIVAAPRERAYLSALQPRAESQRQVFPEKLNSSESENVEQSMDFEQEETHRNAENTSGSNPKKAGTVVAMVDMLNSFNLQDEKEHEEILIDVREECSGFGEVQCVVIPKEGEWIGTAFVQFGKASHAEQAVKAMDKRGFDGKKIQAYIVDDCLTAEEASKRLRVTSSFCSAS